MVCRFRALLVSAASRSPGALPFSLISSPCWVMVDEDGLTKASVCANTIRDGCFEIAFSDVVESLTWPPLPLLSFNHPRSPTPFPIHVNLIPPPPATRTHPHRVTSHGTSFLRSPRNLLPARSTKRRPSTSSSRPRRLNSSPRVRPKAGMLIKAP